MGQMPCSSPNQQRQSTEGQRDRLKMLLINAEADHGNTPLWQLTLIITLTLIVLILSINPIFHYFSHTVCLLQPEIDLLQVTSRVKDVRNFLYLHYAYHYRCSQRTKELLLLCASASFGHVCKLTCGCITGWADEWYEAMEVNSTFWSRSRWCIVESAVTTSCGCLLYTSDAADE